MPYGRHMRRILLSATIALPFAFGAQAAGHPGETMPVPVQKASAGSIFSDLFGNSPAAEQRPVQLAQVSDPRVIALEEQVRQLSGTIEELNFQILQMQEQLRKMQEDNEFRFQQLEERRTDGAPATTDRSRDQAAAGQPAAQPPATTPAQPGGQQTFGTITFDSNGNAVGGGVGARPGGNATPGAAPAGADNTTVAALPATDDPRELYENSYQFVLSGDYQTAEKGFRDLIDRFPQADNIADAHFWLGEAVLSQNRYRDAAQIFLTASRDYPKARKAPDMLLKLGVALVAMDQRDVACATFTEVTMRYPNASDALKERVKQEKNRAAC